MKERRYAVFGAGRQGRAAAYDLAKFGGAVEVIIADKDAYAASGAEVEVNDLLGKKIARSLRIDVTDFWEMRRALGGIDGFVSAMHYALNVGLTKLAIENGCHMVDLGGNTGVVLRQHEFTRGAASTGVSVIPDCGMAPGFDVNLACHVLEQLAQPKALTIYCGGIPERPKPPLGYHFPFALSGLVNECSGYADVIADGEVTQISTLFAIESILVPGIGILEATHTSGGLSTAPWSLQERYPALESLEYKTLRYPGHWKILADLAKAGKLADGLREYEARERTAPHDPEDLGILSVHGRGLNGEGKQSTIIVDVVDRYDQDTGFTAMQRLTGFHASIALIAATEGRVPAGVVAVEALDAAMVIAEFAKRGIIVEETHATSFS